VRVELAISQDDPNTPVAFNREDPENFMRYSFKSFNATTPKPEVFDIPKECMQ